LSALVDAFFAALAVEAALALEQVLLANHRLELAGIVRLALDLEIRAHREDRHGLAHRVVRDVDVLAVAGLALVLQLRGQRLIALHLVLPAEVAGLAAITHLAHVTPPTGKAPGARYRARGAGTAPGPR